MTPREDSERSERRSAKGIDESERGSERRSAKGEVR